MISYSVVTSSRPQRNFTLRAFWNPTIHPHFRNYKRFVRWRFLLFALRIWRRKIINIIIPSQLNSQRKLQTHTIPHWCSLSFRLTRAATRTPVHTEISRIEQQMKWGKNSSQWKCLAVFLLFHREGIRENSVENTRVRKSAWVSETKAFFPFESKKAF